ncbi:MAG: SseB family protein [Planktomarina sp.]
MKTSLQAAFEAMTRQPDDQARRITYLERLVDAELTLALEGDDTSGDNVSPKVLADHDHTYVLAFEGEDRLATYFGDETQCLTLSGRNLVSMLTETGLGIAMNAEKLSDAFLVDPESVAWLSNVINDSAEETEENIVQVFPAPEISTAHFTMLSQKLAAAQGLADYACLATADYGSDRLVPLIFIVGANPGAHVALTKSFAEFRGFAAEEGATWDIGFCEPDAEILTKLLRVGIKIDIPKPEPAITPKVPGADPNKPPILK